VDRNRRVDQEGKLHVPIARREALASMAVNRDITVAEGTTVKELSEKLGIKASIVIKRLLEKKIFASINQPLDVKLAEEVARDFGASTQKVSYEQEATQEIEKAEEEADLVKRAPVVTVMAMSITARRRCSTRSAPPGSPNAKPAGSRSTSALRTSSRMAVRSFSSTRRATKPLPGCALAAPKLPTSSCWWWPPTTA
jgi:hypothetical protein